MNKAQMKELEGLAQKKQVPGLAEHNTPWEVSRHRVRPPGQTAAALHARVGSLPFTGVATRPDAL